METGAGSLGRLYQDVAGITSPGNQYQISGWIKTNNVVGNVVISLEYVGVGGGTPADGHVMEIGGVGGTQDWTFFQSGVFTLQPMPSDAQALWFLLGFNAGVGTAWWDDVSLVSATTTTTVTATSTLTTPTTTTETTTLTSSTTSPTTTTETVTVTLTPTTTTATSTSTATSTVTTTQTVTTTTTASSATSSLLPTSASLVCHPDNVRVGGKTTCTAVVTGSSPATGGTVVFTSSGQGGFGQVNCKNDEDNSLRCAVKYSPGKTGPQTITATYPGDPTHSGSSATFQLNVHAHEDNSVTVLIPRPTLPPLQSDFILSLFVYGTLKRGRLFFTFTGLVVTRPQKPSGEAKSPNRFHRKANGLTGK
ncbi:MAG: Ig-like domain repeat protein [Thaumarchaeota archaeon]|nr:MAG: Ig-like domain repeat protein [Nitrososphaerota archaeon]